MKFVNDRVLKDMVAEVFNAYGKGGLLKKIKELETRLETLEKPKRTRNAPYDKE